MRRIVFFLFFLLITAASCRQPYTMAKTTKECADTVIRWRVVTLYDTVRFFVPEEEVSAVVIDSSHLVTAFATSDVFVCADGTITHTLTSGGFDLAAPIEGNAVVSDTFARYSAITADTVYVTNGDDGSVRWRWIALSAVAVAVISVAVAFALKR